MVINQRANDDAGLGKVLLVQSGATKVRAFYALSASVVLWGVALILLLLPDSGLDIPAGFPFVLIAAGILFLLAFLFGYLKSVKCYERGVVVKNVWRSLSISFSDIAAMNCAAVHEYTNVSSGIYWGTLFHFEIIPREEASIRLRLLGSKKDSNRLWNIVQIILKSNPDTKLLQWN
jgi:hypothetical protein